jgi:7tm Odorant receptor
MLDLIQNYKRSPNPRIAKHQGRMTIICALYAIFIFVLYASMGVLVLAYPLIMTMIVGERTLPFGFILPGLEPLDDLGFCLNWIHHILQVWFTVIGLISTDIFNGLYLLLIVGQLSMITTMFDDYTKKERGAGQLDSEFEATMDELTRIIEVHIKITK